MINHYSILTPRVYTLFPQSNQKTKPIVTVISNCSVMTMAADVLMMLSTSTGATQEVPQS